MEDERHTAPEESGLLSNLRIAGGPSYATVSNTSAGDMYMLNCRTTSYYSYITNNIAPPAPTTLACVKTLAVTMLAQRGPKEGEKLGCILMIISIGGTCLNWIVQAYHRQTHKLAADRVEGILLHILSIQMSGLAERSTIIRTFFGIVRQLDLQQALPAYSFRAITGDAFHDSAERFPQPRCHSETRTKLLNVLWKWACGIEPPRNWTSYAWYEDKDEGLGSSSNEVSEPSSHILWLHGPAGSGKSAVAQSFCQKLKVEGRLGGSFFFKRGHPSRGNANRLFPTLAYQLALHVPELNGRISRAIENNPAIVDRSLCDQLQRLIIEPCRNLNQPVSLVIDGLDECAGNNIQQEVLQSIVRVFSQKHPPLFLFVASRPESHLRETFSERIFAGFYRPLNINQSFQDVRKYLLDEFERIHREHRTMVTVPSPWPISEKVEALVEKSSGYFIYVSTVVKFVDDKRFRPVDRLDIVLGIKSSIFQSPFDTLDQLYHQILCAVPMDYRPKLIQILAVIGPSLGLQVSQAELLLELEPGDVRLILRDLQSVISWDLGDVDAAVHHASFLDYLRDPGRSGIFIWALWS
ncbi:hypothetical protein B0H17DRAFT_1213007 [Mycena rosella]|uniref:Nephrocystin 3-like N-terminal domain-containing protein n=1 Tax=Mycena rosella TaxID=1033263 RepID=A0AAD7CRA8_MYCRO|nr:hypothetical protein B0H17DRAFT_1213007 [Mycena rosella]